MGLSRLILIVFNSITKENQTNVLITKDVPPYAIVGGCPAKVIKFRFPNAIIESLQRIQWWNWSAEKIKENISLIMSRNIGDFISKFDNQDE